MLPYITITIVVALWMAGSAWDLWTTDVAARLDGPYYLIFGWLGSTLVFSGLLSLIYYTFFSSIC